MPNRKISLTAWIARAADFVLAPFVLLSAPIVVAVARLRSLAPFSRSILDRLNVAVVRHHYYEPIVFPKDIRADLSQERSIAGLELNEAGQLRLIEEFHYESELLSLPREKPAGHRFGFRNGTFDAGDAEIYYDMVRHFRPRRIVEIGAGNSTLIAREAIAKNAAEDAAYRCDHVCIEPFEEPWLERLGIRVIRERVELCGDALFTALGENDILFIDSSHVIRPQNDVLHEYLHLLGRLRPGVLIHIHDIFTPRDYPADWILRQRRLWNEQYLLEAFLAFNGCFEVVAAVNWLRHHHRDRLGRACPVLMSETRCEPGSFWLRRRA